MLISHGSIVAGETEHDCAERWRAWYGIARGFELAQVMRRTHPSPPMRVYYRTVEATLGDFVSPRARTERLSRLQKSHARLTRKSHRAGR